MWSRRVVVIVALSSLLLLPAVSAEEAQLEVTGALPLRAAGDATTTAADRPTLLYQTSLGAASWSLTAKSLQLIEVEYWEEVTRGPYGGHSGLRTIEHDLDDARLRLAERLDGFTLLATAETGTATTGVAGTAPASAEDPSWLARPDLRVFRLSAPLTVTAPVAQDEVDDRLGQTIFGQPVPYAHTLDAGALQVQAADAEHVLSGILSGYATGARLTIQHDDGLFEAAIIETIEERPGSVYLPDRGWTGPGSHEERIVRYVQFVAQGARLVFTTEGAPAALFANGLDIGLAGHLAVPSATGTIAVADGAREVEADRLVLSGAVKATVLPGAEAGTATVTGSGDVTYIRTGDAAESFPVSGVAAAAGVALVAALGFALWQHGGLLVGLFSRVSKGDVLDHETRSDIYEAVKAEPGVSPHDLVERTGTGWSTVMYHLNVLERNELIIAIRDGRYRRYFDRTSGRFANGRKQVVAVLKNETSAAIARLIREEPGQVQRRLAERFGLAASSVHWHVKRLVDAGLVVKERRAQVVALAPGPAWEKVDEADLHVVMDGVNVPPRGEAVSSA